MPSLPLATAFTDSATTEAGFKSAITNQREFLAGLLGTTGNQIDALKAMGVPLNDTVAKTGAYTVIASDRGVTLLCSGTFTVSLTAAATLGDGFTFAVVNTGTGVITIDPSSTEQIDGASTKQISSGSSAIVTTNGTAFYSVGGGGVTSLNGQTGQIVNTSLYAIGSYVTGRPQNSTNYDANATLAGSSLYSISPNYVWIGFWNNANLGTGTATLVNTGTWRCVVPAWGSGGTNAAVGLWVRIS